MLAALLLLSPRTFQDPGSEVLRLVVGQAIEAELTDADPVVHTPALDENSDAQVVGRSYSIQLDEAGTYTIELRGYGFDAYLVLLSESGALVAEDDDGLVAPHARIVRALEPGAYRVVACARHGERGYLALSLRAGPPPQLSREEEARVEATEFSRRLPMLEQELGGESPVLASALAYLSGLQFDRGELAASVPLLERAAAIREKALGATDPLLAWTLNDLAVTYFKLGRYGAARQPYERALAIREQVLGPEHAETAASLNDLARLLHTQGDHAAARPLYVRALAIREKVLGPDDRYTLSTLNNLGTLLDDMGEYDAARAAHERVLATRERVLGPEHPLTATSLNNLAFLLVRQGEYSAARPLHERGLEIHRKVYGEMHPATATSLGNLAGLLMTCGDYTRSRVLQERALEIREAVLGPLHAETLASVCNLAGLLQDLGDLTAAKELNERALEARERTLGPVHPDTVGSLISLASVLEELGELPRARSLLERALETIEERFGPQHPWAAIVLDALAKVLQADGEPEQAIHLFERALEIREHALGPERVETAFSLGNLAHSTRESGDMVLARSRYERVLAILERELGPEHPEVAKAHYSLAMVCADLGEASEALDHALEALSSSLAHARRVFWALSEHESVLFLAQGERNLTLLLGLAAAAESAPRSAAYELSLAWRGLVSRALLGRKLDAPGLADLTEDLRGAQSELSKLLYAPAGGESPDRERLIRVLRARRNAVEVEIARLLGERDERAPTLSELRSRLPGGSAWLDFLVQPVYEPGPKDAGGRPSGGKWSDPLLSAWVLRSGGELRHFDLGPASEIESRASAWLRAVVGDARVAARGVAATTGSPLRTSDGKSLTSLLWEPLAAELQGSALVFVRTDSFLGAVPLEVLPLEGDRYLIEEKRFVYASTPLDWVEPERPATEAAAGLLVVGGVDFRRRAEVAGSRAALEGAPGGSTDELRGSIARSWSDLPATDAEARKLQSLFDSSSAVGQSLLLTSEMATEERLKVELPRHSFAHLATHGFFHPGTTISLWDRAREATLGGPGGVEVEARTLIGQLPGLLTGLVCAGANEPPPAARDDGLLTAEEVLWLDLSRVDLVVLSACETALGESRSGEGMIGLRRAFGLAGARTVISSLWSVKDRSTSELMQRFYENLLLGKQGRADALRNAQLEMLARNRATEGDGLPSTWGAFVLSGEWR